MKTAYFSEKQDRFGWARLAITNLPFNASHKSARNALKKYDADLAEELTKVRLANEDTVVDVYDATGGNMKWIDYNDLKKNN